MERRAYDIAALNPIKIRFNKKSIEPMSLLEYARKFTNSPN